jgi:hypothetical protein
MDNMLPFPINEASTDSSLDGLQGQTYTHEGLDLMLVKTGGSLTAPGGYFYSWADRSEDAATITTKTAGLAEPGTIAGLVPATLSGNVASDSYLFVIVGGKENNRKGTLNSVAFFSSAQVGAAGKGIIPLSSGTVGVFEVSSTVQQGYKIGVTNQVTSSSTWLSSDTYGAAGWAEVTVQLSC